MSLSHRVEHPDGDYTIVLSSIVPGRLDDPVERDYSFLDDDDVQAIVEDIHAAKHHAAVATFGFEAGCKALGCLPEVAA